MLFLRTPEKRKGSRRTLRHGERRLPSKKRVFSISEYAACRPCIACRHIELLSFLTMRLSSVLSTSSKLTRTRRFFLKIQHSRQKQVEHVKQCEDACQYCRCN